MNSPQVTKMMSGTQQEATSKRRWPDYLIIGAAKAGTSSLHNYLCRHPKLHTISKKEPSFFCIENPTPRQVDDYLSYFDDAPADQVCGEASTPYTRWPQEPSVAGRIFQAVPNVKLIYIMRHPVDRAYSQYVHRMTKELHPGQPIPMTFEEHIEEDSLCLDSSDYATQIEQYTALLPLESMLFLFTDQLRKAPDATLQKCFRFLNVDDSFDVCGDGVTKENVTSQHIDTAVGYVMARDLKGRIPMFRHLRRLVPSRLRHAIYMRMRTTKFGNRYRQAMTPVPMKPETRRRLLDHFKVPNLRLEKMLDVDLSHWSV